MGGLFGGGSASIPATPLPAPPVQPDSSAVVAAQQAQSRQALNRKSINSTIYAGATGGWRPTNATVAQGNPGLTGAAPSVSSGGTKTG